MMKLPRIFNKHKIFFLFLFFLSFLIGFAFIKTKPALAQGCPAGWCSIYDCVPDIGCVEPGGVMSCKDVGYRECVNSQWVPTDKTKETPDKFHYSPMGGVNSLERFQEVLKQCAETGDYTQECLVGGPEQMQSGAASGIIPNTANAITTMLVGPINPEYAQQAPTGAINTVGNLIAGMYGKPPASSVQYFADLGRNLGIVKPAYAQGIGFIGLNPVLKLWKTFRNIAYLFFVVIFVFVGFAIMFRLKIDPQTVISIQNALPKIIMALILVTFSYAIAGLLIDLIYVSISLIFALLGEGISVGETSNNLFEIASKIFGGPAGTRIATNLGTQLNKLVGGIFTDIVGSIFGVAIGILASVIFAVAIVFALFRLFFSLLISYVSIIVGVIFSPLILMLEALPGQRGLGNWLKMMLSNIIVFPVTAGILAIAKILSQDAAQYQGEMWVAPFLGTATTTAYIPTLIAIGILLLAGSIIDGIKKAIGAPGIGAGIGAPIAGAWGAVSFPVRYPLQLIRAGKEKAITDRISGMGRQPTGGSRRREETPFTNA